MKAMTKKKYLYRAFKGEDGTFGVRANDHVLYEPMFSEACAKRLAQLESGNTPPKDWHAAEQILEAEGLLGPLAK